MFDGDNITAPVIGTYCGQQRNLVLYSSESTLLVTFETLQRTANTQNRGFKGIFEFSESFVKLGKESTYDRFRFAFIHLGFRRRHLSFGYTCHLKLILIYVFHEMLIYFNFDLFFMVSFLRVNHNYHNYAN